MTSRVPDYKIPERAFFEAVPRETSEGMVYTASYELDSAIKIGENYYKSGNMNPEDALKIASSIIGTEFSGRGFNHEAFVVYLVDGVRFDYQHERLQCLPGPNRKNCFKKPP